MPPHSSHLLQPLDIGCFAVLKRSYGRLVETKMRVGINHIDKLEFLEAYPQARSEAFKPETIQNSFAAAGLVPYNPDRVLSQLDIQLRTPTPPGSRGSDSSRNFTPKTPQTLKQLRRQAASVQKLIKEQLQSLPTSTDIALGQLIKGCQLAMQSATLLAKENEDLRAANEKRRQKRTRSTYQITHKGSLSAQEARELIEAPIRLETPHTAIPSDRSIQAPKPPQQSSRRQPRCSSCQIIGHSTSWCPNR